MGVQWLAASDPERTHGKAHDWLAPASAGYRAGVAGTRWVWLTIEEPGLHRFQFWFHLPGAILVHVFEATAQTCVGRDDGTGPCDHEDHSELNY